MRHHVPQKLHKNWSTTCWVTRKKIVQSRVFPGFFVGASRRAENRGRGLKAGAGAGFLGRRQQAPPFQLGGLGSTVSSLAGFGTESWPPKGFPLFSALRMASPDTIILLIVDYHAAIGAAPLPSPPKKRKIWSLLLLFSSPKMSSTFVDSFSSYPANTQTDKGKNIIFSGR